MTSSPEATALAAVTAALEVDPNGAGDEKYVTVQALTDICSYIAACPEEERFDIIVALASYGATTCGIAAETLGVSPHSLHTEMAYAVAEADAEEGSS